MTIPISHLWFGTDLTKMSGDGTAVVTGGEDFSSLLSALTVSHGNVESETTEISVSIETNTGEFVMSGIVSDSDATTMKRPLSFIDDTGQVRERIVVAEHTSSETVESDSGGIRASIVLTNDDGTKTTIPVLLDVTQKRIPGTDDDDPENTVPVLTIIIPDGTVIDNDAEPLAAGLTVTTDVPEPDVTDGSMINGDTDVPSTVDTPSDTAKGTEAAPDSMQFVPDSSLTDDKAAATVSEAEVSNYGRAAGDVETNTGDFIPETDKTPVDTNRIAFIPVTNDENGVSMQSLLFGISNDSEQGVRAPAVRLFVGPVETSAETQPSNAETGRTTAGENTDLQIVVEVSTASTAKGVRYIGASESSEENSFIQAYDNETRRVTIVFDGGSSGSPDTVADTDNPVYRLLQSLATEKGDIEAVFTIASKAPATSDTAALSGGAAAQIDAIEAGETSASTDIRPSETGDTTAGTDRITFAVPEGDATVLSSDTTAMSSDTDVTIEPVVTSTASVLRDGDGAAKTAASNPKTETTGMTSAPATQTEIISDSTSDGTINSAGTDEHHVTNNTDGLSENRTPQPHVNTVSPPAVKGVPTTGITEPVPGTSAVEIQMTDTQAHDVEGIDTQGQAADRSFIVVNKASAQVTASTDGSGNTVTTDTPLPSVSVDRAAGPAEGQTAIVPESRETMTAQGDTRPESATFASSDSQPVKSVRVSHNEYTAVTESSPAVSKSVSASPQPSTGEEAVPQESVTNEGVTVRDNKILYEADGVSDTAETAVRSERTGIAKNSYVPKDTNDIPENTVMKDGFTHIVETVEETADDSSRAITDEAPRESVRIASNDPDMTMERLAADGRVIRRPIDVAYTTTSSPLGETADADSDFQPMERYTVIRNTAMPNETATATDTGAGESAAVRGSTIVSVSGGDDGVFGDTADDMIEANRTVSWGRGSADNFSQGDDTIITPATDAPADDTAAETSVTTSMATTDTTIETEQGTRSASGDTVSASNGQAKTAAGITDLPSTVDDADTMPQNQPVETTDVAADTGDVRNTVDNRDNDTGSQSKDAKHIVTATDAAGVSPEKIVRPHERSVDRIQPLVKDTAEATDTTGEGYGQTGSINSGLTDMTGGENTFSPNGGETGSGSRSGLSSGTGLSDREIFEAVSEDYHRTNDISIAGGQETEHIDRPVFRPAETVQTVDIPEEYGDSIIGTVVTQAELMLENGTSSAVITLEPPSLGRIKLEIVTERSKVTGKITVDNQDVKQIVENRISELKNSLSQNGLKVESFDVQLGHNDGTDSWARREDFERERMQTGATPTTGGIKGDPKTLSVTTNAGRGTVHDGVLDLWV